MLSDHDLTALLFVTAATLLVTTIAFAVAWVRARERVLRDRAEARPSRDAEALKTAKLEHAVDAIAVEVERISEGQRFLAKLLGERHDAMIRPVADASPVRINTPH